MAVKIISAERDYDGKLYGVIGVDQKSEAVTTIEGTDLESYSVAITPDLDVGILDENGTWHWS